MVAKWNCHVKEQSALLRDRQRGRAFAFILQRVGLPVAARSWNLTTVFDTHDAYF